MAGPTMLYNLDRQVFSDIQSKLFPKFGLISMATSGISVLAWHFINNNFMALTTGKLLIASGLMNALNYFYLFPKTISILDEQKALKDDDPKKAQLKKKFGPIHGVSMLANIFSLAANVGIMMQFGNNV